MRYAIASGIGFYQRKISPHKGYCCAHNHLHHRGSCSAFGKRVVLRYGVLRMLPLLWRRLRACHQAALALTETPATPALPEEQTTSQTGDPEFIKTCASSAASETACCLLAFLLS